MTRGISDWRNDVQRVEAAIYDQIRSLPSDQVEAAVSALPDAELRALQRCVGAAQDDRLKPAVVRAVQRRPHHGAWPVHLRLAGDDGTGLVA